VKSSSASEGSDPPPLPPQPPRGSKLPWRCPLPRCRLLPTSTWSEGGSGGEGRLPATLSRALARLHLFLTPLSHTRVLGPWLRSFGPRVPARSLARSLACFLACSSLAPSVCRSLPRLLGRCPSSARSLVPRLLLRSVGRSLAPCSRAGVRGGGPARSVDKPNRLARVARVRSPFFSHYPVGDRMRGVAHCVSRETETETRETERERSERDMRREIERETREREEERREIRER